MKMPIRTSVEDLIITCSRMKAAQQACSQHVFDAPLSKHSKASGTVFGRPLLLRVTLLHVVDLPGRLVLQIYGFVRGLVTQVARLVLHPVEGGLFRRFEVRRLCKFLFAERNNDDALAVATDLEGQR